MDPHGILQADTNDLVSEWLNSQNSSLSSEKAKSSSSKDKKSSKSSSKGSQPSSSGSSASKRIKVLDVIKRRLKGQLLLVESAMETDDSEFIRKESHNLDKIYDDYLGTYSGTASG